MEEMENFNDGRNRPSTSGNVFVALYQPRLQHVINVGCCMVLNDFNLFTN